MKAIKPGKIKKPVQKLADGTTVVPNPGDLLKGYQLPANIPQADPAAVAATSAANKLAAQNKAAALNKNVMGIAGAGGTLASLGGSYLNSQNMPDASGKVDESKSEWGGALSGAGSGAATGASIGSFIPGVGTAIGAGAGALIGGISGYLSGKKSADEANSAAQKAAEAKAAEDAKQKQVLAQAKVQSAIANRDLEGYYKGGYIKAPKMGNGGLLPMSDTTKKVPHFLQTASEKPMSKADLDQTRDLYPQFKGKPYKTEVEQSSLNGSPSYRYSFYPADYQAAPPQPVKAPAAPMTILDPMKQQGFNGRLAPVVESYMKGGLVQKCAHGGGIHINPAHKGDFTAYKERTGKTTEEALHSEDPHVRQMANFARNAKHWNHKAEGGLITGPGTAKSDSIPAKVKGNSFVVPAENAPAAMEIRKQVLKAPKLVRKMADGGFLGMEPNGLDVAGSLLGGGGGGLMGLLGGGGMSLLGGVSKATGGSGNVLADLFGKGQSNDPTQEKLIQDAVSKALTERKVAGLRMGGLVQKCAEGGLITGPGTAKSDSIPAKVKGNSFIVPAENAPAAMEIRKQVLKAPTMKAKLNQGSGVDVKLSNGEVIFTPEEKGEVEKSGIDLAELAPHAALKFSFADGGLTPDKAKLILQDGTIRGHKITEKQRRFFGWKASQK